VRLIRLDVRLVDQEPGDLDRPVELDRTTRLDDVGPGLYAPVVRYLVLHPQGPKGSAVQLEAEFRVEFKQAGPLPPGFDELFRETVVPRITTPYIRELTGSMAARMGLPPLTMPLEVFTRAPEVVRETQRARPSKEADKSAKGKRSRSK
jgi:hypothetical protein